MHTFYCVELGFDQVFKDLLFLFLLKKVPHICTHVNKAMSCCILEHNIKWTDVCMDDTSSTQVGNANGMY